MLNIITKKVRNPIWTGIVIISILIIIFIFASRILYERTVTLLTENLRERILTISITAATNIDSEDLDALQTEEDWKKPEWTHVTSKLHKAKYSNKDIVFMYIFRKKKDDPTRMEFVADADSVDPYANTSDNSSKYIDVNRDGKIEPDGPDKLQWPGQDYPEAIDIPEAWEAYNGPLTNKDLYTDAYGTVITGYAPIKDRYGNVVAILATDIKADDFFTITRQTLQPFLIFIVILTLIITILTIVIIYIWRKYAGSLEKLAGELGEANEKLKELDQLKSEFLSLATHQIRAPLTAIKGYSSMLLDGDFGILPQKAKDSVDTIMKSCQNLINIVGDFLNISRIEQGRMVYEKSVFDVNELVKEVITEIKPNIDKTGLSFGTDIPTEEIKIKADRSKIKQVVSNIIDNAMKYTPKGNIFVSVYKDENKVKISVKDSGVGIDPSEIDKLFNKFSRAKDANKVNVIGTGLGLYIAKKMTEAHGGDIKVSSDGVGKGSTFTIELPL
ncbi:MAG: HAMP domain-containing sensor histidine kinase [Patescibacteria group bacterium]